MSPRVVRPRTAKFVSPPLELNPIPAKRTKFRNMLTRDGGLIEHEEVREILERKNRHFQRVESLDFWGDINPTIVPISNNNVELLNFDQHPPTFNSNNEIVQTVTARHDLESLDFAPEKITFPTHSELLQPAGSCSLAHLSNNKVVSSSRVPSTPSTQSSPMITINSHPATAANIYDDPIASLVAPLESTSLLLDLEVSSDTPHTPTSSVVDDLMGLMTFQSCSLEELAGLNFQERTRIQTNPDVTLVDSRQLEAPDYRPEEAIVFQGRLSRRVPQQNVANLIDPDSTDRAFQKFSQGMKSRKSFEK